MPARPPIAVWALGAMLFLGACGSTTIDTSVSTTSADQAATTTTVPIPTGITDDLRQMVTISTGLGDLIVEGGDGDDEAIARIHALWDGTDGAMNDVDPTLFREVEHQLGLLDNALEHHRPADADKAARNLGAVVDTYLERHPG